MELVLYCNSVYTYHGINTVIPTHYKLLNVSYARLARKNSMNNKHRVHYVPVKIILGNALGWKKQMNEKQKRKEHSSETRPIYDLAWDDWKVI